MNTKTIDGRQYDDILGSIPGDPNPIKDVHDLKTTRETVRQLLAGGTPNWVKWPQDYKAFAKEQFAMQKEVSDTMAKAYQIEDQDILSDPNGRMVNAIPTRDFVQKLRDNGVKCFTIDNGYPPQTVAFWAVKPGTDFPTYVCYLQVPAMYEWSVLKLDRHNVPVGEDYRGWRTVLSQMIIKDVITEQRAHEIFGKPAINRISRIYRRTLWQKRHGMLQQ